MKFNKKKFHLASSSHNMLNSISNRISGLFRTNEHMEHPHGKSITIHSILNDRVQNDFGSIEKLLNHPDVRNRKIVVFSIIGAYRRGKSFFLDYCLRYLYANVSHTMGFFNSTLSHALSHQLGISRIHRNNEISIFFSINL